VAGFSPNKIGDRVSRSAFPPIQAFALGGGGGGRATGVKPRDGDPPRIFNPGSRRRGAELEKDLPKKLSWPRLVLQNSNGGGAGAGGDRAWGRRRRVQGPGGAAQHKTTRLHFHTKQRAEVCRQTPGRGHPHFSPHRGGGGDPIPVPSEFPRGLADSPGGGKKFSWWAGVKTRRGQHRGARTPNPKKNKFGAFPKIKGASTAEKNKAVIFLVF